MQQKNHSDPNSQVYSSSIKSTLQLALGRQLSETQAILEVCARWKNSNFDNI